MPRGTPSYTHRGMGAVAPHFHRTALVNHPPPNHPFTHPAGLPTKPFCKLTLRYAAQHGIQFWSFCNYPIGCKDMHPPSADCPGIQCCADNVGLSYAWDLYLQHPDRHKVNFTLLLRTDPSLSLSSPPHRARVSILAIPILR